MFIVIVVVVVVVQYCCATQCVSECISFVYSVYGSILHTGTENKHLYTHRIQHIPYTLTRSLILYIEFGSVCCTVCSAQQQEDELAKRRSEKEIMNERWTQKKILSIKRITRTMANRKNIYKITFYWAEHYRFIGNASNIDIGPFIRLSQQAYNTWWWWCRCRCCCRHNVI